ncbi:MAG TPA: hypothetical protein PKC69_02235 [Chitinophagaceae bacterium]|nr:hypothetical protein [Chitinophagaceae bacterium]
MSGISMHTVSSLSSCYVNPDMRDCYTCSFTEFYPFCPELYYFSSLKKFAAAIL